MFEVLEHTADIGFRAWGNTLEELFAAAAEALVAMAIEIDTVEPRETYFLQAVGDNREELFVNWLNEVLYYLDGRRLAMKTFSVEQLTNTSVRGTARGEPLDPRRHPPKLVIKGVTYHQLRIEKSEKGWECDVYLDI
jgi:SHS2 domain-containing protein